MTDIDEFDDELEQIFTDKTASLFGEASDEVEASDAIPTPADMPKERDRGAELDAAEELIAFVVAVLKHATTNGEKVQDNAIVPTIDVISQNRYASMQLPRVLRAMQVEFDEVELVRVLTYFAYRSSPLYDLVADVDYETLSGLVRRFLASELMWNQVKPHVLVEMIVDEMEPVQTDKDSLAASTVAGRLGLKYTDVLLLAGVTTNQDGTPADGLSMVSLARVSSEFNQVCAWCVALEADAKSEPKSKTELDPTPQKPDEASTTNDADDQNKPFNYAVDDVDDDDQTSVVVEAYHMPSVSDLIDIDPNDTLSEYDNDWFVVSCKDLADIMGS